jgi:hypothetical protein
VRRRTLLLVFAGIAAVAVAIAVVMLWLQPERITRENFGQLRKGTTRAEVESILGPPGDYRKNKSVQTDPAVEVLADDRGTPDRRSDPALQCWATDKVIISVLFDAKDRVTGFSCTSDDATPIRKIHNAP